MGCTLSGVCLTTEGFLVFNAGDSRVYRLRDGILRQLTSDDSVAAIAVAGGVMSAGEAEASEARHTIVNLAGSEAFKLRVLDGPEVRDGDSLVVCTDGVHDLVPLEELEGVLAGASESRVMAERVMSRAIEHGGRDNISLVVIRRAADGPAAAPEGAAGLPPAFSQS
jgi:protein phosphatase